MSPQLQIKLKGLDQAITSTSREVADLNPVLVPSANIIQSGIETISSLYADLRTELEAQQPNPQPQNESL